MSTTELAISLAENIKNEELRKIVLDSLEKRGDWTNSVRAFHALYECPDVSDIGTTEGAWHMSAERLDLRMDLIKEEVKELDDAVIDRNEVEMADALGDIIYVVVGFAIELGINLNDVVAEIQASNMTKLGDDGEVIRRDDGKILKGPNYKRPDIKGVLKYR